MPTKTIVKFSTKGGVGKTLIASNLAVALAKYEQKKVCLIDLDTHTVGDMARVLDVRPEKAMVDLINLLAKAPEAFKKEDFFLRIPTLNIDFLAGVLRPQQSPHLDQAKA